MAMMLGRKVWYGLPCSCCNSPRGVKVERVREKRALARELHPGSLLPTAEPADDCQHGCNGDCVHSGSERCNFTCHDLEPEAERLFERMDRRAMEIMGEKPARWKSV